MYVIILHTFIQVRIRHRAEESVKQGEYKLSDGLSPARHRREEAAHRRPAQISRCGDTTAAGDPIRAAPARIGGLPHGICLVAVRKDYKYLLGIRLASGDDRWM